MLIMSDSAKLTLKHEMDLEPEDVYELADVTLKEQRRLVLAVRETPLSAIHLRNMQELAIIPGVRIIPPMLTYYIRPKTLAEMNYHIAAKLLEPFGIEAPAYQRWEGLPDGNV